MRFPRPIDTFVAALTLALGAAACSAVPAGDEPAGPKPDVGFFSTLPIYWGEDAFGAMLDGSAKPDWVREEMETRLTMVPLDTLEAEALAGLKRVVLAQPRALAPSENMAFDAWVRKGGRAVIFADPMLTRHSHYPIGDRRRPQDVVLLSPILDHWGLTLTFDDAQPVEEQSVALNGVDIPVRLAGRLQLAPAPAAGDCTLHADRLAARCAIGGGHVLVIADAAVFDWEGDAPPPPERRAALWQTLATLLSGK